MTLRKIKTILTAQKLILAKKFNVKEIALFGSYVRGENKSNSDIDILVEFFQPIGLFAFMDCEEYLEKILGIKVDLVSKKALKPQIGKQVLKEMIPV
ncbi:MAG: nucleotidyltransferase [Deltaproteobacteria bacterium CG11_big_fil_rev_8_21_14_0_20_49_13]|nr:MAG: nucleotidyltransferase [Deltaproteobacteria bacterium CG11_big_fil_rev_8_21_14_0_20_49_13]